MQRLKILHLEDTVADAKLVLRALKKGLIDFELLLVDNKQGFQDALADYLPDIILSDHSLPSFNSYEALSIFQQTKLDIPFILITATISEDFAVDIIKRGADDYILKDRLERLPSALMSVLEKFKLSRNYRANLEELSRASDEKIMILESIRDGFYALDNNWTVTYWNKEAERILGRSRADIIGKNIWEIYPEAVPTVTYDLYHLAKSTGKVQHFERFQERLGVWLEVSVYPSPNGLSIYLKDFTERKLQDLERSGMVNDILQRNKDLEQFSYIVSHNLRAPVANISGLAAELIDTSLNAEEVAKLSNYLMISVKKLDDVIIDLNQVLQAKRELHEVKEKVVLTEIMNDVMRALSPEISALGVSFVIDFSPCDALWTVKSYFYSIFYNLISNAIKYSRPDVPLLIEVHSRRENAVAVIVFKDNGLGIDLKSHGEQLFGLYKRFHQHVEGKGMGLFMVKTQLETLGGNISVTSTVNEGSEFMIVFPISKMLQVE